MSEKEGKLRQEGARVGTDRFPELHLPVDQIVYIYNLYRYVGVFKKQVLRHQKTYMCAKKRREAILSFTFGFLFFGKKTYPSFSSPPHILPDLTSHCHCLDLQVKELLTMDIPPTLRLLSTPMDLDHELLEI